jgi:hypothetical protein
MTHYKWPDRKTEETCFLYMLLSALITSVIWVVMIYVAVFVFQW